METTVAAGREAEAENETLRQYVRQRTQVAECLEDLARVNDEVGQVARAARIRETRDSLLTARFTLLVLGEFKRGKSTLVNRLLGRDVLPVGAAPTTAVLTRVTYGDEPAARLVLEDGTERPIALERLSDEITLAQSDEGLNRARHAGIARAEIALPVALCRDGVDLVDSPGLGEHTTRTEVTYEALPAADAVVFVSDAAQLGSEDESFVQSRLSTQQIDNVFFVINKWDRVYNEAEDVEAEIGALKKRAWSLFVPEPKVGYNGQDPRANHIYPLSCRPNLAPEEERAQLDALWEAFRADLEAFLVRESGRVALGRALARARAALAETQSSLRARGPALATDLAEFERRVSEAEAALHTLEGPRQAIREAIARRRAAIREEVRARATGDLPAIEAKIKEEFEAREYRPAKPFAQRMIDGMQDSFRRQKIRDELRAQAHEIATAQVAPWATALNNTVEQQITALLAEVETDAGRIEATFQSATRIIGGLDAIPSTEEQEQQDLLQRGLAAGVGVLLADPFLIMSGGMHGFKGLGRTMLYQFAGIVVVSMVGLPVLPVLVAGAVIASVQNNDDLLVDLKKQALQEVIERVQAMRTTELSALQTAATEPLEACGTAIEHAIEGRIQDHRETVNTLRAQLGQAREANQQERSRLEDVQEQVTAIAGRLESVGFAR